MITTSNSLIVRIRPDFSFFSAHCPALAENRKNGRMNRPAARFDQKLMSSLLCPATLNAFMKIGSSSCRARVCLYGKIAVVAEALTKHTNITLSQYHSLQQDVTI